jgi:uncharacterized SAM-binding protein YcdF (DUF218 family)
MAENGKGGAANRSVRGCVRAAWRMYVALAVAIVSLQLALVLWGFPQGFHAWITTQNEPLKGAPRYIVCLGGAGIPSESGLVRTYYAAEYGKGLTNATWIVSLPCDGEPETNSVGRMRDELVMRGVPSSAIRMEHRGWNTHQQAMEIARMLGPSALKEPVLIVTSPYHCRRSLLCFRRAGFARSGCTPAEDVYAEANPGKATRVRYGFWSALDWQLRVERELFAMAFYKLRGWI